MLIREFERGDYASWLPLWQENCEYKISDDVTAQTWQRLTHKAQKVHGLGLFNSDEVMIGFLHYILHPTTGCFNDACYMQDIFIATEHRGQGLAKRLMWELQDVRKKQNWSRIYWFAENSNLAAQNLYKTLGMKLDFSLHMILD